MGGGGGCTLLLMHYVMEQLFYDDTLYVKSFRQQTCGGGIYNTTEQKGGQ
jgi:hypothetical protein